MIKRTLAQVAQMCGGQLADEQYGTIQINGVCTDSRQLGTNQLFIPIVGDHFDGHRFVSSSMESGAEASLWQRDHGPPPAQTPVVVVDDTLISLQSLAKKYLEECQTTVVAVTGSNGKTTTKDIIYSLLSTKYDVHKTEGNFNNHIGMPLTILSMASDAQVIVLEMGMSGRGEIKTLSNLARPDVAVITNVTDAHLLQLGSRMEIARAKVEIVCGIKEGGLLIYNGDDDLLSEQIKCTQLPAQLRMFTFGFNSKNNDYPIGIMNHEDGVIFMSQQWGHKGLHLPLIGQHNVINALAAMAVARQYEVDEEQMDQGMKNVRITGRRLQLIHSLSGVTFIDDTYNANPSSMKAAIDVLQSMKGYRQKIAVLGDMLELGPTDLKLHLEVGQYVASSEIDILFTYGELSTEIARGARERLPINKVYTFSQKDQLIAHLKKTLHPEDIVLVKASRGMGLEKVIEVLQEE